MRNINLVLILLILNINLCAGLDSTINNNLYKIKLAEAKDKYFPIRNATAYIAIEEIRRLDKVNDYSEFTALIFNSLKEKYLPPFEYLPIELKHFSFSRIQMKISIGTDNRIRKKNILKLYTLMNNKYDTDYLYDLPSNLPIIYQIIIDNKDYEIEELFKEFISSMPRLNLILLADINYSMSYIDMLCNNKSIKNNLSYFLIDPDFYSLAYEAFQNININNYQIYYCDQRLFPGLNQEFLKYKLEYIKCYRMLISLEL